MPYTKPYIVLGNFKFPRYPHRYYIYGILCKTVKELGFRYEEHFSDIRTPGYTSNEIRDWHPDGESGKGTHFQLIFWASSDPPEFRLPNKTIWQPQPGDLVLVRNWLCEHRQPPFIHPDRLFVRFWDVRKIKEKKTR